jgi:hypothetical protein
MPSTRRSSMPARRSGDGPSPDRPRATPRRPGRRGTSRRCRRRAPRSSCRRRRDGAGSRPRRRRRRERVDRRSTPPGRACRRRSRRTRRPPRARPRSGGRRGALPAADSPAGRRCGRRRSPRYVRARSVLQELGRAPSCPSRRARHPCPRRHRSTIAVPAPTMGRSATRGAASTVAPTPAQSPEPGRLHDVGVTQALAHETS